MLIFFFFTGSGNQEKLNYVQYKKNGLFIKFEINWVKKHLITGALIWITVKKNCSKFVFIQNLIICFLVCPSMTTMTRDKGGGVIYDCINIK